MLLILLEQSRSVFAWCSHRGLYGSNHQSHGFRISVYVGLSLKSDAHKEMTKFSKDVGIDCLRYYASTVFDDVAWTSM